MSKSDKPKNSVEGTGGHFVDPNSGAATQPGGYAYAPVVDESFDAAVADAVTEEQEAARQSRKEAGVKDAEQDKKADAIKKAAASVRTQDEKKN